jgi:hypothetical protein
MLSLATNAASAAPANANNQEPAPPASKPRIVIGRIEYVVLQDVHIRLKGRIDTGAGLSSVDAKIIEVKQSDDGERVVFQINDTQGGSKTLERKVVKWVNIKVLGAKAKSRRPVVRMDFCLGGKKLEGRVNLADRSGYLYPVLIGRNLLKTGGFLVDPREKFLKEPGCE